MIDPPAGAARQLYRHYKGDVYELLHHATMEHDERPCVVYRRADSPESGIWVRYAEWGPSPFFGEVTVGGQKRPRFVPMDVGAELNDDGTGALD
jgi:hypothetical protein